MKAQRHPDSGRNSGTGAQRLGTGPAIRGLAAFCCFLLLAFAAGAASGDAADGALQVVVNNNVQVSGDRILLGQISGISGGSDTLRRAVAGIDLGPAPRPGQARRITGNSIGVALAKVAPEARAAVPGEVQIRGAFQHISEASLEAAFKTYVMGAAGKDEVAISRIDIRGIKALPIGKIALTPLDTGGGEVKGKTSLRLSVTVDGEDCGQVTVSGWVDRYARVVCAARSVPRDTVLSAEDLRLERINIAKAPDRLILEMSEAVGKRARSNLQAGKYLQQHKLSVVPLIERGDRVKLLVNAGPVNVSTIGIARADGGAGDQIRVENLSSEKTVVGRVVNDSTVEVLF